MPITFEERIRTLEECMDKGKILERYANRDVRQFAQYDGFSVEGWDKEEHRDAEGRSVLACVTWDLMGSPFDVRVLVDPNAHPVDVVQHLRVIVAWLERAGIYNPMKLDTIAKAIDKQNDEPVKPEFVN